MTFTIARTPYSSPAARLLCDEVQAEYVVRYGSGDMTEMTDADFEAPNGDFLVVYDESGDPVGCGGWRAHGPDAEMKRVYVRESARRQGLAKRIVAAVEESAAAAGRKRLILETGPRQPEAVAMYALLGYAPVDAFGYYSAEDGSIHLGKELATDLPH
ncbi:GNAT family N-acetyltransferase [Glycomyces sp. NPDC047010]|uniref:GNAT family N-acetyltransferase n=1 Tax=Glycomyces sp. NPDC047010 TaxID=3155023 RepID=UPI0033C8CB61